MSRAGQRRWELAPMKLWGPTAAGVVTKSNPLDLSYLATNEAVLEVLHGVARSGASSELSPLPWSWL